MFPRGFAPQTSRILNSPTSSSSTGISHPQLLKVQADKQHACTIVNGVSRIGYMTGGNAPRFKDEDMTDTYLSKAIEFVEGNAESPFFMYYAPNENHVPRVVHPRFQGASNLGPRGDALVVFEWCVGSDVASRKTFARNHSVTRLQMLMRKVIALRKLMLQRMLWQRFERYT